MRNLLICLALTISFPLFSGELQEKYDVVMDAYENNTVVEAKKKALTFLQLAKQQNDQYYLVKTYFLLGYLASHTDDFGNSIIYYLEGARFAHDSDNPEIKSTLISIYKNLGRILGDYHHYDLAHKFINQGLVIASHQNDQTQIQSLLFNRIHELLEEEKYEMALHQIDSLSKFINLSEELALKLQNTSGIAHKNLGVPGKAISNFEFVLQNGKQNATLYASALQNLGNIYFESFDYNTALKYYNEQISICKSHNLNQLLFQAYEVSGQIHVELTNYQTAIAIFQEAVTLKANEHLDPTSYSVYEKISSAYEEIGNIQQALHYKNIYAQKLEEFIAEQKRIEELDKKYNIQLLTERYFDLLAANEKQHETETIAKIGVGSTIFVFLMIIFSIYYRQYRVKRSIKEEMVKIEMLFDDV